jgi:hypothetical protein
MKKYRLDELTDSEDGSPFRNKSFYDSQIDASEPIVIASFLLPFTLERDDFGNLVIKKCFHNPTLMYGSLHNMMQKRQYNFRWIGIISTLQSISEGEKKWLENEFQ